MKNIIITFQTLILVVVAILYWYTFVNRNTDLLPEFDCMQIVEMYDKRSQTQRDVYLKTNQNATQKRTTEIFSRSVRNSNRILLTCFNDFTNDKAYYEFATNNPVLQETQSDGWIKYTQTTPTPPITKPSVQATPSSKTK